MTPSYWVDGVLTGFIPVDDRGFLYGDGLFETIPVRAGKPQLWQRHLARLQHGCQQLALTCPDTDLLTHEVATLCDTTDQAVIKIIVTRGSGGRGYRYSRSAPSRRILAMHPWPDYPLSNQHQGIELRLCQNRLGRNPKLSGLKHLHRLEQVVARSEWHDSDIAEGVMLDSEGCVIEGTMSNIFMIKDGSLITPDLRYCGVAGIMRGLILEVAVSFDLKVKIKQIDLRELIAADEIFVCNSIMPIWPVRLFQGDTRNNELTMCLLKQVLDHIDC